MVDISSIIIQTCKPVQLIYGNAKSKPPARIERWNLRLQGYDFSIGSQNPSDFLSRHTSLNEEKRQETMAEEYVHFLSTHAVPKAMTLSEIQAATKDDPTLQKLAEIICNDNWMEEATSSQADHEQLKAFHQVKDELTVNSEINVILHGSRIVIPASLQQKAISLAHEGHQGIVKMKKLLRKCGFLKLKKVTKVIQECIACQ